MVVKTPYHHQNVGRVLTLEEAVAATTSVMMIIIKWTRIDVKVALSFFNRADYFLIACKELNTLRKLRKLLRGNI